MIRTFELHTNEIEESDPWSGILAAVMFATRATVHTTLQATPSQLVFGRDALLNIPFKADWALIRERKQKLININNKRENRTRKEHNYRVGDKVSIKQDPSLKYGANPFSGPVRVIQTYNNGTIRYQKGRKTDVINIRNIKPYHSRSCLLYTSPSPRDQRGSRMPSSA